jgi:hypothetical protein
MHDSLLYCTNKFYVPASSVHLLFLQEAHGGGLMVNVARRGWIGNRAENT